MDLIQKVHGKDHAEHKQPERNALPKPYRVTFGQRHLARRVPAGAGCLEVGYKFGKRVVAAQGIGVHGPAPRGIQRGLGGDHICQVAAIDELVDAVGRQQVDIPDRHRNAAVIDLDLVLDAHAGAAPSAAVQQFGAWAKALANWANQLQGGDQRRIMNDARDAYQNAQSISRQARRRREQAEHRLSELNKRREKIAKKYDQTPYEDEGKIRKYDEALDRIDA